MAATGQVDLMVLGGGPGGYAAAFYAADHGLRVALIERDHAPGGVCLHRGCIPSKALLHVAKLINETREAAHWGIDFGSPRINLDQLRDFKSRVVSKLTGGTKQLCVARGVEFLNGWGTLTGSNSIHIEPAPGVELPYTDLQFERGIIATGSSPAIPRMFQINDHRVMDSTGALDLPDIPGRLMVIGGGYIGLEMGSVYAALGSRVTVVEMLDRLLATCDADLVRPLERRLKGTFEAIHLNTRVAGLESRPEGVLAHLEGQGVESPQLFDRVLVSIGRRPNLEGYGLENTRVQVADGFIHVDRSMRTTDPSLWAIGDVVGQPMLAHKAAREGKVAIEAMLGMTGGVFDNIAIPAVVFTDPEIAWCGLTEMEAKERGINVKVIRFPWAASGRAQTIDRVEGVTKMLVDPDTERVLGVGIVGPGAGELIAEGTLAVETAAVARDLADTIHAHPTLSETVMEAAEGFFGHATHVAMGKKKQHA